MPALSFTIAGHPGATAPPRGTPAPDVAGVAGSAQLPFGSRARWPADTVSHPSDGHVSRRVVRTLSAALDPSSTRPHSAGVPSRSTSLHSSPGTPTTTTRPSGAAAAGGASRTDSPAAPATTAARVARRIPALVPR
ncbi:hypothetical protein DMH08_06120 [Actinomadura sp. WAC 06369]|nr:hypothetical protein DMH08_06120 [Actinomadura sp. WAC 06369]